MGHIPIDLNGRSSWICFFVCLFIKKKINLLSDNTASARQSGMIYIVVPPCTKLKSVFRCGLPRSDSN